jgi:hypothetical protein
MFSSRVPLGTTSNTAAVADSTGAVLRSDVLVPGHDAHAHERGDYDVRTDPAFGPAGTCALALGGIRMATATFRRVHF